MSEWLRRLPCRDGAPLLGKVRVLREIGRGGVGVVYAGWHTVLDIPVAVKLLRRSEVAGEEMLARFRREAHICAAMDEPCLVRVFDFDSSDEGPYIVMEHVAGRNLDAVVAVVPLDETEVLSLLRDLALVLLSLHRAGVVHRDIKPSNLLLRASDGRIKLTDLGIAKAPGAAEIIQTKGMVGTPAFMSPEQCCEPDRVGPASDFFSLGATAYHLLTGERPFGTGPLYETMRHICEEPLREEPLREHGVSEGTVRLLHDLMAKSIDDRIITGRQLLERLPATSVPFRPETLEAARPGYVLHREDAGLFTTDTPNPAAIPATARAVVPERDGPVSPRPRALLICECLQNDFIAPIPAGKPAPNKLHIGRDEALRVVGADPAMGPLVRALSACAGSDHLRIVHVRDWHDPDDPRQQAELKFFGPHCVMGTWGARFVDAIESYSRDRGRSAVVDATGINDFEDTPLLETLEALIGDEDRATVPVGVIGVWTNVKVQYLLYDLKTRARLHNLATCSRLVAAPDRVEHRNALRHLESVLNVKVFHEVDEFLAFLGVEPVAAPLPLTP
jgi:nicotinamidase-related amidase/tRNA A-37 threonylcarbamoyl transferase component Bud32